MPSTAASPPPPASSPASARRGESSPRRSWREWFTIALIGVSALGAALVLARQAAYGVSVSVDSITYLAVAERLLQGRGFLNFDYGAYTHHAPLYPLLLAAASLGVFEPVRIAGLLNAGLFAATVLVMGRYLRRRLRPGWLAIWGAVAVALSLPLGDLGSWALSETAFVLFSTLALTCTDDFLTEGRRRSLVGAAVFSALAWQTRYLGVVVPVVSAVALWIGSKGPLSERVRRSGVVALAAGLPMALWMARNYLADGHFAGDRQLRASSWSARFGEAREGFESWFAFEFSGVSLLVAGLVGLGVFAAGAHASSRVSTGGDRDSPPSPAGMRPPAIFLGYGFAHLVVVMGAAYFGVTLYGVEERYLAPLYVPMVIAAAFAFDRVFRLLAERAGGASPWSRFARAALATALFSLLLGLIAPTLEAVREANGASPASWRGFTAPPWDDSEMLGYLRDRGIPSEVFSNLPILLHLYFGDNARAYFRHLPASGKWSEWLENTEPGAYVAWFRHPSPTGAYDYGFADLSRRAGLEPVARFGDGAIFRVDRDYTQRDPYRAAAAAIASGAAGEPLAQEDFDLYLDGTTLVYSRESCAIADTESRFFLHAYTTRSARGSSSGGLRNLDFSFEEYGARLDEKCIAIVDLPATDLVRIRTGQYESGGPELWSAEVSFAPAERAARAAERLRTAARTWAAGSETLRHLRSLARSGGNSEGPPDDWVRAIETGTLLLRLGPALPPDTDFIGLGDPTGRAGLAPVAWASAGAVFRVDPDHVPRSPHQAALDFVTSGAGGEPIAGADFDLFLVGPALLYFRAPCAPADTEPRFFLHMYPTDPALLPPSREPHGFENLDFAFPDCGERLEGECVAIVELPETPWSRIRTGQFGSHGRQVWVSEFSFPGNDAGPAGTDSAGTRFLTRRRSSDRRCVAVPSGPERSAGSGEARGLPEPGPDDQVGNDWIGDAAPGALVAWLRPAAPAVVSGAGVFDALMGGGGLEPLGWFSDGAVFRVNPTHTPDLDRAAADFLASGAAGDPVARADFDLYLDGRTLFYWREPCEIEDTTARFALHVYRWVPADLPASRVRYGFENLDFWFSDFGRHFDGKCLISTRLPDYRITRIQTAQYEGQTAWWATEFLAPWRAAAPRLSSVIWGEEGPR